MSPVTSVRFSLLLAMAGVDSYDAADHPVVRQSPLSAVTRGVMKTLTAHAVPTGGSQPTGLGSRHEAHRRGNSGHLGWPGHPGLLGQGPPMAGRRGHRPVHRDRHLGVDAWPDA